MRNYELEIPTMIVTPEGNRSESAAGALGCRVDG
jgi:hypothetical protein